MSVADTTTTCADTDPLTGLVHHHSYKHYRTVWMSGLPAPTICGFIKTWTPDAWKLPCCPMCAAIMASKGINCGAKS